jgi:hypothetical protein
MMVDVERRNDERRKTKGWQMLGEADVVARDAAIFLVKKDAVIEHDRPRPGASRSHRRAVLRPPPHVDR